MTRFLVLAATLALAGSAHAQDWQVIWSDEFDLEGAPDPTKWGYDIGGNGWGNQELQLYTDRPENARVEDGVLIIEAREEALGSNEYTSARLVTRDRAAWTYGRIEARIKLPIGQGIWPAFWMLPQGSPYGGWPTSGEIDVMEYLGHETDRVHGTIHYGGVTYAPCRANRGAVTGHCFSGRPYVQPSVNFSDDFHTFAIEWEPTEIRWYVDDVLYQTQTYWYSGAAEYPAPFDQPFHLLLNVAVGGQWPGYPDETTVFPQQMLVDYVRVFRDASLYPEVQFDGPESGAVLEVGSSVSLAATASDGARVEFLQGDGVLGTDTEAPFALEVGGLVDGCYALGARAVNEAGYATETERVEVVVGAGCPEGSRAPYLMAPVAIPGVLEAENYDLGGPDVAYRDFSEVNEFIGIRQSEGVDLRPSGDLEGGYDVASVVAREWLTYSVDVAEAGPYQFTARAAAVSGGRLRLSLDGEDLLGTVEIASTGGSDTYADVLLGTATLPAGRHVLRLDSRGGDYTLNRLAVTRQGATALEDGARPELELRVSPNPAADHFEVGYRLAAPGPVTVAVFDVLGRQVETVEAFAGAGPNRVEVDVRSLPAGAYLCALRTEEGTASVRVSVAR